MIEVSDNGTDWRDDDGNPDGHLFTRISTNRERVVTWCGYCARAKVLGESCRGCIEGWPPLPPAHPRWKKLNIPGSDDACVRAYWCRIRYGHAGECMPRDDNWRAWLEEAGMDKLKRSAGHG